MCMSKGVKALTHRSFISIIPYNLYKENLGSNVFKLFDTMVNVYQLLDYGEHLDVGMTMFM